MSASTSGGGSLSPQAAAALQEGIGLSGWCSGGGRRCRWLWRTSGAAATPAPRPTSSPRPSSPGSPTPRVAEQLLIMHEECLENNFSSIEKLRNTRPQGNAVSQSRQMVTEDDDDSSDDGDEPSIGEDEAARSEDMAVDQPKPSKPTPDADGWPRQELSAEANLGKTPPS